MQHVAWQDRPQLRRPVLVAAFEGWNDAADAASSAARYLRDRWSARPFASIDPEEFYDFTATRPQVRLVQGITRRIEWPETELSYAALPGTSRDVVVLLGHEPQLKWRTFSEQVVGVAEELGVELVIILGALLADVPHTRPVRVTGTAADGELVRRLGLGKSTYEGPTGIVGVLHEAFSRAHVPSASLWAAVPHYVASTPSPKASLALVERATDLLSSRVATADLELAVADYERQVSEVVAADEDVIAYVRRLELSADDDDDDVPDLEMVSGDALADELERYLRDQGDD
ncbi:MAG TPA: PAC2 family protein [Acidimicrobiales bacterium]|nr:PAC2 family protein [Acidimicrobiales bacterium]